MIRILLVSGLLYLLVLTAAVWWNGPIPRQIFADDARSAGASGTALDLPQLKLLASRLESIQQPLEKPHAGDWLAEHQEDGQTFSEFLMVRPKPVPKAQTTFYLQPIGTFTKTQKQLLQETAQGLELFYGRKVVFLKDISLMEIPANSRRINDQTKQPQILTTYVMDELLLPKRPQNAIAVLALSAEDLWPGKGWNYVFGQAYLSQRVGVWSIARFGNPDDSDAAYRLCLERMLGTALHESGHMLGIQHCKAWNCCMNGSNNLPESDRHPLWFCAECQPKVWYTCSLNPEHHLAQMSQYAEQLKLKPAAVHWARASKLMQDPK